MKDFGLKAARLTEIENLGLMVPEFVVVSASEVKELSDAVENKNELLSKIVSRCISSLGVERYAVRSAALIEDDLNSSYAGQFLTKLQVKSEDLPAAIEEVVKHGREQLGNLNNNFSLIVQKCLDPEYAGVVFSTHPNGSLESVVEYKKGLGEEVVGGGKVKRIVTLAENAKYHKSDLGYLNEILAVAKKLEEYYDWPQDIEWAVEKGQLFILQTRPVTNFKPESWSGIKLLNNKVLSDTYCYTKGTLAEVYPCPKPLTLSILNFLYEPGGPIDLAYQKYGVKYQATNQLLCFGNEVFVDKEKELQSILPAFGFRKSSGREPSFFSLKGFWQTLKNQTALNNLSGDVIKELDDSLNKIIQGKYKSPVKLVGVKDFLREYYPTVFEVNLLVKKLEEKMESLPEGLTLREGLPEVEALVGQTLGNTFSLEDDSPFVANVDCVDTSSILALREKARWVSVILKTEVKEYLLSKLTQLNMFSFDELLNATLDEVESGVVDKELLRKRHKLYQQNQKQSYPETISNLPIFDSASTKLGLSTGEASGVLVSVAEIDTVSGNKILLVDKLTPDLTKYFKVVNGIVTREGGLLSHLAIVAREAKLPVVKSDLRLRLGQVVSIDGETGAIIKK